MTKYKKPKWAVQQIIRPDRGGMVEDVCKYGVGHPNVEWLEEHPEDKGVHGCCGCCISLLEEKEHERNGSYNTGFDLWPH